MIVEIIQIAKSSHRLAYVDTSSSQDQVSQHAAVGSRGCQTAVELGNVSVLVVTLVLGPKQIADCDIFIFTWNACEGCGAQVTAQDWNPQIPAQGKGSVGLTTVPQPIGRRICIEGHPPRETQHLQNLECRLCCGTTSTLNFDATGRQVGGSGLSHLVRRIRRH